MPEIACVVGSSVTEAAGNFRSQSVKWAAIKASDTCKEFAEGAAFPKSRVHVFGTWGGASLSLGGRNSTDATALTLMDRWGNLLTFTENEISEIYGGPAYLIPVLAGGDGTTNLTVIVELGV